MVKQCEETTANEQERGNQIIEITFKKGGGTLNAYLRA